jgi:repressor LexA
MVQKDIVEQVYAYIRAYIQEHTYPPTLKEIADAHFMSRSNVTRYLDRLQGMGLIARDPGRSRGITLLDDETPTK